MKGGRTFCGKWRVIFIDNIKEETGDYRRYRGGGKKARKQIGKQTKNYRLITM